MDETNDGDSRHGNAAVEPGAVVLGCFFLRLLASSGRGGGRAEHAPQEVRTKRNGARGGDGEQDELHGEDAGCEILGFAVDALEVDFFAAGAGDGGAEF